MTEPALEVEILPLAIQAIEEACNYIAQQGYPERANSYHHERLRNFALSLGTMPLKYAKCKRQQYAIFQLRCAIFENTYIFAYQIFEYKVLIVDVVHGKKLA
jgi:plasmid stabilization system protein ParE